MMNFWPIIFLLIFGGLMAAETSQPPPDNQKFIQAVSEALKKAKADGNANRRNSRNNSVRPLLKAPLYQNNLRSSGSQPNIHWRSNGTPRLIQGRLLQPGHRRNLGSDIDTLKTAQLFLSLNRAVLKIQEPDQEFVFKAEETDHLTDTKRLRFHQQFQGLEIWPSEIAVHLNNQGDVVMMNGNYTPTPRRPIHSQPAISSSQAIEIIKKLYAVQEVAEPELIIFNQTREDNNPFKSSLINRLAWRFNLNLAVDRKLLVIIDATNGERLSELNQVHKAGTSGSGLDLHGLNRDISIFEQDNRFYLIDTSKPMFSGQTAPNQEQGSIFIYDWENQSIQANYSPGVVSSSQANGFFLADGVSAAYNLSEVFDYFYQRHNRNSLDGNGGSMLGIVRFGDDYQNALWTGSLMLFGDGLPFASSLDVVGHELTHGVIQNSANLVYENQSGALNEAFADIFGEMAQSRTLGKTDWVSGGDDLNGVIVRSFKNPEQYNQPSNMSNFVNLPNTEDGDNGGVHINSGIINHAFYQLASGLPNAIGIEKAEKIFYRALTIYLLRNSEFIDARLAAIKSAEDLYGSNSNVYQQVLAAFDKVGISEQQPGSTTPSSFPPVSNSSDAYLMACLTNQGNIKMCRYDPELGDSGLLIISDSELKQTRISVQANGELATFIDKFNDLCLIVPESGAEACLGYNYTFHSVALSADGNRVALTTLDFFNSIEKSITVLDMKNDQEWSCKVTAPTIDSNDSLDTIIVLDSLAFASDGKTLFYDAKSRFQDSAGQAVETWTIYQMDSDDCQIRQVVQPAPGKDIGFPSMAQTSDNFLTHDVFDENSGLLEVKTINLNNGNSQVVASYQGTYAIPAYNGNDSSIAFMYPHSESALGFQTVQIPLAGDRMTANGEILSLFEHTAFPTIYRHGSYNGQLDVASFYDLNTQILRVYVDYSTASGTETYTADLKLQKQDQSGLYFKLLNAVKGDSSVSSLRGTLNSDFSVDVPRASLTDELGNTSYYQYRLKSYNDEGYIGFFMPFSHLIPL